MVYCVSKRHTIIVKMYIADIADIAMHTVKQIVRI